MMIRFAFVASSVFVAALVFPSIAHAEGVTSAEMAPTTPSPATTPNPDAPVVELSADDHRARIERRTSTTSPTLPILESEDVGSKGFRTGVLAGGIGAVAATVGLFLWLTNGSSAHAEPMFARQAVR
jgi:hypothetical protein